MKKLQLILLTAFAITTLISCQKQPNVSFKTDKTEYTAGETIKLTNTTVNGHFYKWTMPDGQTLTSTNVDYILNGTEKDGTLTFKLESSSKNGNKRDETQSSVTVKAAMGKVTFWNEFGSNYPIAVAVGNEPVRMISQDYASSPSTCNANGCANFNLKVGSYLYAADDGLGGTWSGTITIQKDGCLKMELVD